MRSFIKEKGPVVTTTLTCAASIGLAILADELYGFLSATIESDTMIPIRIFTGISIILLMIVVLYFISWVAELIKRKLWAENADNRYMKHAFLHVRKLGSIRQESFQEAYKLSTHQNESEFMIQECLRNMQLVVKSCYDFFDSAFSTPGQLVDDIKFEATFMTKSYRDNEITIPCSANKENRTPISMLHRTANPQIFSGTETDKIYNMERPVMVLIEDTAESPGYIETYRNQKRRIRSSVIMPVLSHENVLLGTLVVHCNKAGFFKNKMYDFWNELLEMFSVEIGYQKILLDYYIQHSQNTTKPF